MLKIERLKTCLVAGMILLGLYRTLYSDKFDYSISKTLNMLSGLGMNHSKAVVTLTNVSTRGLFNKSHGDVKFMVCSASSKRGKSRLGNRMFDFASALGIARTLNHTLVVRPSLPLLDFFVIDQPIISDEPEHVLNITLEQWRNDTWKSDKNYFSYNLTLSGYFRVWRYFQDVFSEVRKSLTIKPKYIFNASNFLHAQVPRQRTLIGVHVRRGDFLHEKPQAHGKTVASKHYIQKAMKYFRQLYFDAFFIIVSDDKTWCRNNLAGNDVIFSEFNEPIIDMAILSRCNHTIITSGTFGWWGGWLSGGTVVYWTGFPRPGSFVEEHVLFRGEFYPPNWIGLESD